MAKKVEMKVSLKELKNYKVRELLKLYGNQKIDPKAYKKLLEGRKK